jgi:large subunit ribosomal protein L19
VSELLAKTAARYVKPKFTDVASGDTVRVYTRIKEGDKERTQYFEGVVIRRRGGIGPNASFTVRRGTGVGVERTFPLHSPVIERIEVQRGAKVRKAQIHYLRGRTGKAARLTEQPVKQADRDLEHPWPERYGVVAKEIHAVEEVASEEQLKAEEAEGEAAAAEAAEEKPETVLDQAQKEATVEEEKAEPAESKPKQDTPKAQSDDKAAAKDDTEAKPKAKAKDSDADDSSQKDQADDAQK